MKVYAPNQQYNGVSAGVRFRNGVGETDKPLLLSWFCTHGYKVGEQMESTKALEAAGQKENTETPEEFQKESNGDTTGKRKRPVKKAGE